jgi:hypothetical protein
MPASRKVLARKMLSMKGRESSTVYWSDENLRSMERNSEPTGGAMTILEGLQFWDKSLASRHKRQQEKPAMSTVA